MNSIAAWQLPYYNIWHGITIYVGLFFWNIPYDVGRRYNPDGMSGRNLALAHMNHLSHQIFRKCIAMHVGLIATLLCMVVGSICK